MQTSYVKLYKEYYRNGNLKLEAMYVDGLLDGEYKRYYPEGELEVEAGGLEGGCGEEPARHQEKHGSSPPGPPPQCRLI